MKRITCWKLKGKKRVSRECGRRENGFSIRVCKMSGGEKWPVFFFMVTTVSSPTFWMFHKELRSLMCLLLPWALLLHLIHCIKAFCLWSALTTKLVVSCLMRLSSSVWRWIPKKCLDEWMDGWAKQKALSSVRDWRACLNNAQCWLT